MKWSRVPRLLALGVAACVATGAAAAQADDDTARLREELAALRRTVEQLSQKVEAQQAVIRQMQAGASAPPAASPLPGPPPAPQVTATAPPPAAPQQAGPPSEPPPPPSSPPPAAPAAASPTSNYFNPSVSVIGNYLGVGGRNRVENLPASSLRESEVGLQAIVDPYARADFFLSFGEEGVDVEEGFATFTSLPASLLVKVGRMRSYFGKINTLHLHVLPWPDEPLPVVNFLGSDGWVGTGVSLARLFPLPGDTFSEGTLEILQGDAPGLFQARSRGDLAYDGHYRVFKDLTEATNLDLGLSYATGPTEARPSSTTRLEGLDFTLRWKPLRTATYRSFTARGELMRSRRQLDAGDVSAVGWFLSGDYPLAKRWFVGARLEAAQHADDRSLTDRGQAMLVTFWPSEFSQLRAEARRRAYGQGETANEILLQLQFAIGAHGAHPF